MKRTLLKVPAFAFAGVYLVRCVYYVSAMLGASQRNFTILLAYPAILGIALFVVYGVRVCEKTGAWESMIIGVVNIGICVMPLLVLSLLMSPLILLTLPSDTWMELGIPMLMSMYPFGLAIWKGLTRKHERVVEGT